MATLLILGLMTACLVWGSRAEKAVCDDSFSNLHPYTQDCCENDDNSNYMFADPPPCCTKDGVCYCDPSPPKMIMNPNGNCLAVSQTVSPTDTMAPTTTTPTATTTSTPTTPATTTTPAITTPTTTTSAIATPITTTPTTMTPPTTTTPTTMTPPTTTIPTTMTTTKPADINVCPQPPTPAGRLLNGELLSNCDPPGLFAFTIKTRSTNGSYIVVCHAVFQYSSNLTDYCLETPDWCWNNIKNVQGAQFESQGVFTGGAMYGKNFTFKGAYVESATTENSVTTLQLVDVFEDYLLNLAVQKNCDPQSHTCTINRTIYENYANKSDCFFASYGKNDTTDNRAYYNGVAYKVKVEPFIPVSSEEKGCNQIQLANGYPTDTTKVCFVSTDGGAMCGVSDATAPLYCSSMYSSTEYFLIYYNVPARNCSETNPYFWVTFA